MNWYKLLIVILLVLVAWTALILGGGAYAAFQYKNTSAMYCLSTCVGLLMVLGVGLWKEIT